MHFTSKHHAGLHSFSTLDAECHFSPGPQQTWPPGLHPAARDVITTSKTSSEVLQCALVSGARSRTTPLGKRILTQSDARPRAVQAKRERASSERSPGIPCGPAARTWLCVRGEEPWAPGMSKAGAGG